MAMGRIATSAAAGDVRGGRQTESGHCHAHPGAEQGAKAVEAMHHRQHRFIHLPLDGRAFDVKSDLCGAEAGAEDSQTEGEQRGGSDPQRGLSTSMPSTAKDMVVRMTLRVPKRFTSHAEQRIPLIDPTDRPNSTTPISAVDSANRSRIAGVRVAQRPLISRG